MGYKNLLNRLKSTSLLLCYMKLTSYTRNRLSDNQNKIIYFELEEEFPIPVSSRN